MKKEDLRAALGALLFVHGDPLSEKKLLEILPVEKAELREALSDLAEALESSSCGVQLKQIGNAYQLATQAFVAPYIETLTNTTERKLSVSAMETLSIIAFKQPITRQEIEAIRGVAVHNVLRNLQECKLIKEVGRREGVGRPILYGTTEHFLKSFKLKDLQDLSQLKDKLAEQGV